jgi:hypothetical protein
VNNAAEELGIISRKLVPVEKKGDVLILGDIKRHFLQNQHGEVSPMLLLPQGSYQHASVIISYNEEGDYFEYINLKGEIEQGRGSVNNISQAFYWKEFR